MTVKPVETMGIREMLSVLTCGDLEEDDSKWPHLKSHIMKWIPHTQYVVHIPTYTRWFFRGMLWNGGVDEKEGNIEKYAMVRTEPSTFARLVCAGLNHPK